MTGGEPDFNRSAGAWLLVRTLALTFLVIGLTPADPPNFSKKVTVSALLLIAIFAFYPDRVSSYLPMLVEEPYSGTLIAAGPALMSGLTVWHWVFSSITIMLAFAAVLGKVIRSRSQPLDRWLTVALVLLAGSQLHNSFWPSAYSPVLTTGDLLRLGFTAMVAIGGVIELKRISGERAALLALERENASRLQELATLKEDFTAMIAHEIGSPLAAISGLTSMVETGALDEAKQTKTLAAIHGQISALNRLVADAQTVSAVDYNNFMIQLRSVPISDVVADAVIYAESLSGGRPLVVENDLCCLVKADPGRIGQVLRNLISNADKYSLAGAPIALRLSKAGRSVIIQVQDEGFGLKQGDHHRIFEKFTRVRHPGRPQAEGVGLGLYLSRHIVRAHDSELSVNSQPGKGSTFSFQLEAID